MKLIEALKQKKALLQKAADLRKKVTVFCAYPSYENATYGSSTEQAEQVRQWVQAHKDVLKEVLKLHIAIQATNLATQVTIELGGEQVTKSIAEWTIRRRALIEPELEMWNGIGDRGIDENKKVRKTSGELEDVRVVRCYDPKERDRMRDILMSEPTLIDQKLEIVNAVTDIIGYDARPVVYEEPKA